MARKQKHEEHENLERWLVSYADFITLLFAFFVVMYSISSVNEGKYRVLSDALVAAFRSTPRSMEPIQIGRIAKAPVNARNQMLNKPAVLSAPVTTPITLPPTGPIPSPVRRPLPVGGGAPAPVHSGEQPQTPPRTHPGARAPAGPAAGKSGHGPEALVKIAAALERSLAPLVKEGLIRVRRHELWVEVEIRTKILFPSGSAGLAPAAAPVLERIARILKPFPNAIHVEGFTDNVPIHTVAFPSNWELSAARAASVVHLFMKDGIDPHRMAAIGYGQYRPVASNATAAGRARNRRVVLVVLAGTDTRTLLDSAALRELAGVGSGAQRRTPAAARSPAAPVAHPRGGTPR